MKWLMGALCLFAAPMLMLAPIIGMLVDPFAPFRLSGQVGQINAAPPVAAVPIDPAIMPVTAGGVTDAFRYQLARLAGWSHDEAIIATAVSIAEDGSGNPTAMSPRNSDGSYDWCLWQINSVHWSSLGGQQALADPQHCANAAHVIFGLQGWAAWTTYRNGAYRAYLSRAQAASDIQPLPGAA